MWQGEGYRSCVRIQLFDLAKESARSHAHVQDRLTLGLSMVNAPVIPFISSAIGCIILYKNFCFLSSALSAL
jgi:hypothetical protein